MYESFHGRPSEQIVMFNEDEHYHEYLSELGICCGVLVELEDGSTQAIGLSGYEWHGKGKDAGFVESGKDRQNPKRRKKVKGPFHQASDLILGGASSLDDQLGAVLSGNPRGWKTTYQVGSHDFSDRTRALKKAKEYANDEGSPITITIRMDKVKSTGFMGAPSTRDWKERTVTIQPDKTRRNPDSDSVGPNTTLLSSNEDGTQLYLVGGDQSLDLDDLDITGDCATKELVTIGDVVKIYYETQKDFDKFEDIQYHHELGEETGELPILAYDRLNQRLLFVGGAYHIEKPWGETSPGLEN